MMRRMQRRGVRRPQTADRGFSLPELIVAIALTSILMTLVVTLFVSFSQSFTRERALTNSTTMAGIGMNEVTKVIRAGTIIDQKDADLPIFLKADKESVVLFSYLAADSTNPAPVQIELTVTGGNLIEKRWTMPKTGDYWVAPTAGATASSSRVIVRDIAKPTGAESYLFTYLAEDGSVLAAPVTPSNRGNIAAVQVTMAIQSDPTGRADKVTLAGRVGIPNLVASRLGLEG